MQTDSDQPVTPDQAPLPVPPQNLQSDTQRMTASQIVVATQGVGIVTADQLLRLVSDDNQTAIVNLYYSATETDKPSKIRELLNDPK